MVGLVVGEPAGQVNLSALHSSDVDGVTGEEVRDDSEVAILGKLVSNELAVGVDAEDVGQDQDGLVGLLLGLGEVGLDCNAEETVSKRPTKSRNYLLQTLATSHDPEEQDIKRTKNA